MNYGEEGVVGDLGLPAPQLVQASGEGLWGQVEASHVPSLCFSLLVTCSVPLHVSVCPCPPLSPGLGFKGSKFES